MSAAFSPAETPPDLVDASITTIRTLAIDAVQAANSGHPGMPMGCAPIAYVLFREVLRHDPAAPGWPARDRFVLSAGHGSMLLYAALHLSGYERPTLEDLKAFRQWGSATPGHPERGPDHPGVETTTGPLGQGFANGVGMALAAERLSAELDPDGIGIVPQRVYAIVSDGDLMEGISSEAASLAGHLQLGRLTYLYDDNRITIDGSTEKAFSEDVLARFDAYGWHIQRVSDGNDLDALRAAIAAADADPRPSLIAVRTVIGFGSPGKAGTAGVHGAPLGEDEVAATKHGYGWDHPPFHIPAEVADHFDARARGAELRTAWDERVRAHQAAQPELAAEFERRVVRSELPDDWTEVLPSPAGDAATRKHSGAVITALAPALPELFGGSADLAASNNTDVPDGGDFSAEDRLGRNLRFGIREHAMVSMANGMALHGGLLPYVASFLVFTDYCRPAIRLAALMGQRVVYVMTHDSIGLGEDGPTHQPVEHLASLRLLPGLSVWRPADGHETAAAWRAAITADHPTLLALSRQTTRDLGARSADAMARGGYVLRDVPADGDTEVAGDPDVVLVGTGSEVAVCSDAADLLAADGVSARVVSLPAVEVFLAQDAAYRDEVLPSSATARVAVEAGVTFGWERIVGAVGEVVGLDRFGASAPSARVLAEFGFTPEHVAEVARATLAKADTSPSSP
ncbi:MAG: transketolase [Nitriliruptoraceae bacterium]